MGFCFASLVEVQACWQGGGSMRILSHPVLGELSPAKTVKIYVDGNILNAREGESIAAALAAAGIRIHRYTPKRNEPRGVFCGIGQCSDCIMTVNGVPNVKTCITPVADGMVITTQYGTGGSGNGPSRN